MYFSFILSLIIIVFIFHDERVAHRNHGEDENHGENGSEKDAYAHRSPHRGILNDHRNDTHRGSCRGEENRTHSSLGCEKDGLLG